MTINALDNARRALELWEEVHGGESLDQQCQRFTGYYEQWAATGTEAGIIGYPSARAAKNASSLVAGAINAAPVGACLFWTIAPYDHVGRVVGHENGRALVVYATRLGDTVLELSHGVKVSHADTYPHPFAGWALGNGRNTPLTLSPWAPAPIPAGRLRTATEEDGIPGRVFWTLFQTWARRGGYAGPLDGAPGVNTWRAVMSLLRAHGYTGPIDGIPGRNTWKALQRLAAGYGYTGPIDGIPGPNTYRALARFLNGLA